KSMGYANLVEDLHKVVPCPRRAQQRKPPVTTERDEMEVAASVESSQRSAHKTPGKETSTPAPFAKTAKSAAPLARRIPCVVVPQWYTRLPLAMPMDPECLGHPSQENRSGTVAQAGGEEIRPPQGSERAPRHFDSDASGLFAF